MVLLLACIGYIQTISNKFRTISHVLMLLFLNAPEMFVPSLVHSYQTSQSNCLTPFTWFTCKSNLLKWSFHFVAKMLKKQSCCMILWKDYSSYKIKILTTAFSIFWASVRFLSGFSSKNRNCFFCSISNRSKMGSTTSPHKQHNIKCRSFFSQCLCKRSFRREEKKKIRGKRLLTTSHFY